MTNKVVRKFSNDSALSSEYIVSCSFFSCADFECFLTKILRRQGFCLFQIGVINTKVKQTFFFL